LITELKKLDDAFKSQDPEAIAELSSKLPLIITEVANSMQDLKKKMQTADSLIPVTYKDKDGNVLSEENARWTTRNYKKDKSLISSLYDQLPKQFKDEIPVGKRINKPLNSFTWYNNYSPSDIVIKSGVYNITKDLLAKNIRSYFDDEATEYLMEGFDAFLDNLKKSYIRAGYFSASKLSKCFSERIS
jgi:hypothetical protein